MLKTGKVPSKQGPVGPSRDSQHLCSVIHSRVRLILLPGWLLTAGEFAALVARREWRVWVTGWADMAVT